MKWLPCSLACLMMLPAAAAAERAVVLVPRSEVTLAPAERDALTRALEAALRSLGIEPVAGSGSEPCLELACLAAQIAQADADHAVELKVWRAAGGDMSGVSVSLVRPDGARYSEGAPVTRPDDFEEPLSSAMRGAYERLRRGPGPWLELNGRPEGAAITVDGLAVGSLPRQVKVNGGLHHVVVTHPGRETFDETVTVPRNPDALKRVTVSLRAKPAETRVEAPDEARTATSAWNYAIAGAAAATGVLLAIGPSRTAFDDGACGRMAEGRCTGVVDFDAGQGLQLTTAGLLFAGSIAFAIWAPLEVRVDRTGARAALRGSF